MSYIYGSNELAYAIADATQRNVSISMANSLVQRAYQQAGLKGVQELASDYGVNCVVNAFGYPEYFTMGGVEGVSNVAPEILYRNALEGVVESGTDDVVFATARQVVTENGAKTFLSGAVKTATSAINLVGAIATGAQLGWDSYKEHPDFWTDLSESIFGNGISPDGPVEVLARAYTGGYTTAVKEREVCAILEGLAKQGAFDYKEYESTLTETGVQYISLSEIQPTTVTAERGKDTLHSIYPNDTVVQITEQEGSVWITSIVEGVYMGDVPSTANVSIDQNGNYVVNLPTHRISSQYNKETGQYVQYELSNGTYIISGEYVLEDSGSVVTGGLCVDITTIQGNNALFPNDHNPNNLSLTPTNTLSQIAQIIKEKFPAWYGDSWEQLDYNMETGTTESNRYYPVTTPYWDSIEDTEKPPSYTPDVARRGDVYEQPDNKAEPQGKENTRNNERINTDTDTKPVVPVIPPSPTPSDPGGGAGGTSDALWSVYNPTMQELNALGSYLWTNNIVELLEKFLQNPMDAIISLHKVYCQPDNGNRKNIILGYLDSNVSALTVTNQFKTIDCGTVDVQEYFQDARDYDAPYTIVECYLPFVGIVRLRTEDIIGGKVNIVYTVDVYSGACLCKIFVTKLGAKQLLYNFSGNCSMQIPLTGADRTRLLSGAITGMVTGAFAGAEVGAVAGAVMGAFMGGTSIDRTSGFSANAGCMGVKKPYLIITRKYSYDAGYYNKYYGFPSNITVQLGTCRGYTRVKSVHIENLLRATDNEKNEIETLLKEGVIIN